MSGSCASSPLVANLATLSVFLAEEQVQRIRSTAPSDELEVKETPSGHPTCRAFGVWVYSRHDPMKDAIRLIDREVHRPTEICVFESFGLGYHLEALLAVRPEAKAVVVEPDLRWFRSALETRDLRRILGSSRVTFVLDAGAEILETILTDATNVQVVRLRSLAAKNTEYFREIDEKIRSLTARNDVNRNTLARFGRRWVRNLIANIALIPRSGGVRELTGSFDGIPALVLAAGPSLDRVLPFLSSLRERFLLVCVDTSYRAALDMGVVPDFLVVVDPQYWNNRHLDGCRLDSTILVSESSTYPAVFHRPLGPLVFCGSLFPLGQYLERAVEDKGMLGAGGSVATTAWDLARILGCGPLVCAGLDLGFPERKTHFRGGYFEERIHSVSRRTSPVETSSFHMLHDAGPYPLPNNAGGMTLTDQRLVIYKWWFENQLKLNPGIVTRNLSRDGVKIAGMDFVELEALMEFPIVRGEIDRRIREISSKSVGTVERNEAKLRETVKELLAELAGLERAGLSGIRAVARLEVVLAGGEDPGGLLAELDGIDETILGRFGRHIAGFLMHSSAHEILHHRDIGTDQEQLRTRAISDSRELYRRLTDAAAYHIGLLEGALERLQNTRNSSEETS